MGKLKDLTGQKFGDLTVIKRYPTNTKDNRAQWECKCVCGNIIVYPGRTLLIGRATSCGCKRKKDLTGKRYGRLIVIEYAYSKDGHRYWKCQCDCGNIAYVNTTSLNTGNTQSCGCLHTDVIKYNNIKLKSKINQEEIIGKFFDYLEVIELIDTTHESIYKCYCHNCGNYKNIKYIDLVSGKIHACGCLYSWAESKLKTLFQQHNINYVSQFKFNDLRSDKNIPLRFDFGILKGAELLCLIEYQGEQHFNKQNPYWTPILEQHDILKKEYCEHHNIKLIELNKTSDLEGFVMQLEKEVNS